MFANCPNYVGSINVPRFINEEREVFVVTRQYGGQSYECTFATREEAQANADYYTAQGVPTAISQRRDITRVEVPW